MDRRDGVLGGHKAAETPYWITPKEDNYSREFAKLEDERMWGKVWLIFCREQELKNPGDFVSVDFVRDSIMVVKQQDGSLRAFYNICQHRGRKLKAGGDGRGYMSGNTGSSIPAAPITRGDGISTAHSSTSSTSTTMTATRAVRARTWR